MINRITALILFASAATALAASSTYYWDYPATTLEPTDRILVYKGYSMAGRDRNITGSTILDPLKNYTTTARAALHQNAVFAHLTTTNLTVKSAATFTGTATIKSSLNTPIMYGSIASSGSLTLNSTSHATKGKINIGATSAYDEAQIRLGIGTQSPSYSFSVYSTNRPRSERKIHTGSVANAAALDAELGLRLTGSATTWNDLRIEPTARTGAGTGTAPAFEQSFGTTGAGGIFSYTFAQTTSALEYLYYALQMPHDWREGSTVKPHIHFSTSATSGTVKFKGTCYGANYTGTFASFGNWSSTTTLSGPAWKHNIAEGSNINMTGKTISHIMSCNLVRKAGDTAAAKAHLHYIDYHYEVDSVGSDNEFTKSATP